MMPKPALSSASNKRRKGTGFFFATHRFRKRYGVPNKIYKGGGRGKLFLFKERVFG
jgi:hypothetical protein